VTTKARFPSLFFMLLPHNPLPLSSKVYPALLPRFSCASLKSHQIITHHSAVPAVYGRPRKSLVSARDKERLLRIARKDHRGPLNSIMDPSQPGAGSALLEVSEAMKKSGQYNVWSAPNLGAKVKVWAAAPSPGPLILIPYVCRHQMSPIHVL
jgi:nucleolar protein 53